MLWQKKLSYSLASPGKYTPFSTVKHRKKEIRDMTYNEASDHYSPTKRKETEPHVQLPYYINLLEYTHQPADRGLSPTPLPAGIASLCQSSQVCAADALSKRGHNGLLQYHRKEGAAVAHRALDLTLRLLQLLCEAGHPELAEEWIKQLLMSAESIVPAASPAPAATTEPSGGGVGASPKSGNKRPRASDLESAAAALRGSSKDAAISIDSDSDEDEDGMQVENNAGSARADGPGSSAVAAKREGSLPAEPDGRGRWMEETVSTSLCTSEEEDAEEGQIEHSVLVHPWSPAVATEARQQLVKVRQFYCIR